MSSEQAGQAIPRPRARPAAAPDAAPVNGDVAFSPLERAVVEARESLDGAMRALMLSRNPGSAEWARQLANLVEVHSLGLGYEATGPDGVVMTLSRLRDSRGDLGAELAVTRWGNHLYQSRLNLSSGTARSGTAKLLSTHPAGAELDWRELLEQLCLGALRAERVGAPPEMVGDRPPADEPARVIDPYLPIGPTLLWGPQGSGKSTLAVAIVVALETTSEVLPGWHPQVDARCLVLDWESSAAEWNERIQRVAAGAGVPAPLVAYRRCRTPLADQVETLAADIDRGGIGYLIVDSFEKAAGARDQGSTYEEKAERVFLALDRLAVPSLLLDHVAGEDLRQGLGRVVVKSIGSTLKGAWARATYDLKRDPDRSTTERVELLLHNVKINDGRPLLPYEFALLYEGERGPIRFERSSLTSADLLRSLPLAEQLARALLHGGSRPTKELAEELETTQAKIRTAISRDHGRRFVRLPDQTIGLVMPT